MAIVIILSLCPFDVQSYNKVAISTNILGYSVQNCDELRANPVILHSTSYYRTPPLRLQWKYPVVASAGTALADALS